VIVRVVRAVAETAVLLTDRKVLRALPWPYIRAAPRRSKLAAVSFGALALSSLCLLVGILVPPVLVAGVFVALVGLLSSWILRRRVQHA
jgi:ABC-type multidrug transport system permease subunit